MMSVPDLMGSLEDRGLVAQTTDPDALRRDLAAGPMTLYCGFDPTAPSLHIGNLVQVLMLRRFQLAGHRPLGLVGGATGLIGDPRPTAERQLNSTDTVAAWVVRIRRQLEPLLDFEGSYAARLVDNLEWLGEMSALDLLRDIGKHFRVNRMIAKDAVSVRLSSEQGISYTEFSYQILQATDFLELYRRYGCRLQTGGSDQWGNLTSGTDLIHRVEQATVHAVSTPLVTKADGTKYGKTASGAVWLDPDMTSPYAMYQFFLNTDDHDLSKLLRIFTFATADELAALDDELATAPQRRSGQHRLATDVTALVHGESAAAVVKAASSALFGGGDLRTLDAKTLRDATAELPGATLGSDTTVIGALVESGLAPSRTAARRFVVDGAVHLNNVKVSDVAAELGPEVFLHGRVAVLRRGRRQLAAVRTADGAWST